MPIRAPGARGFKSNVGQLAKGGFLKFISNEKQPNQWTCVAVFHGSKGFSADGTF